MVIRLLDPILNETVELKTDLLALSVGTVPNPENEEIGKMLKVPTNQDGFFLEAHVKLRRSISPPTASSCAACPTRRS